MRVGRLVSKVNERIGLFFIGKYLEYNFINKYRNVYLNERSIEYEFVLKHLLNNKCIDVLDIGTGSNSFSSALEHCGYNVTATDLKQGSYWSNFSNRHIYVVRDDITNSHIKEKFDAVLCISVLEHISNFEDAVSGMSKLLNDTGILIITFPYSHDIYCENIYKLNESDDISKGFRYIGQSFSNNEIDSFCIKNNFKVVDTQFAKGWSGKFWRTGERYAFPIKVNSIEDANMGCFLLKKVNEK